MDATNAVGTHDPSVVHVVEVGPRDGLQNEPVAIPAAEKVRFVDALSAAGCRTVEVTSFVNPSAVPQMADAVEVMTAISRRPGVRYVALVPNERGLARAIEANCAAIAVFASATESFSRANLGAPIDATFVRFEAVVRAARDAGLFVRGYVSVANACPFEGAVPPKQATAVARRLRSIGCSEIALADTIGTARPVDVERLLDDCIDSVPVRELALHLHDTSGQALANVDVGLRAGIRTFDAAAGGLGGCPFAPGAPGNLATESLLAHLTAAGFETGVDVNAVRAASDEMRRLLGKGTPSNASA